MIFLFPLGKGDTSRGDGRQTRCDGKPLQRPSLPDFSPSLLSLVLSSFYGREGSGKGWVGGWAGWGREGGVARGVGEVWRQQWRWRCVYMRMIIRIMPAVSLTVTEAEGKGVRVQPVK